MNGIRLLARLRGRNNEGVLAVVLLALIVGMSLANPTFLTLPTAFSILRSSIVPLIFALGVLLVIVSGGIDVSFAAIAIFAAYSTVRILENGLDAAGIAAAFGIAIAIGAALGAVNGIVIARFRLPTLIVTLGTQGIFKGALLVFVGSRYIADLPQSMAALSTANVVDAQTGSGPAYLHAFVVPAALLALGLAWLLRSTMFGRSIYAIGDDIEAAHRAGFRVKRTQIAVYVLVGAMAALGGMFYVIMGRSASPQLLVGSELDTIAAVVLGGASIFGGRGSVLGTVLGVLLVQVINNSLILAGVPSAWQRAAVGLLLVAGVGIQALAARRARRPSPAPLATMEVTA